MVCKLAECQSHMSVTGNLFLFFLVGFIPSLMVLI